MRSPSKDARATRRRNAAGPVHKLARGLGWFSIALGAIELAAPGKTARLLGMRGSKRVLQAYGGRELVSGAGILASKDPTPFVWSRVLGDAMDLATLATGLKESNAKRSNVLAAMAAVAGVTALDIYCAAELSRLRRQQAERQAAGLDFAERYRSRSGFKRPAQAMRGAALDAKIPEDFRTPTLLRRLDLPA